MAQRELHPKNWKRSIFFCQCDGRWVGLTAYQYLSWRGIEIRAGSTRAITHQAPALGVPAVARQGFEYSALFRPPVARKPPVAGKKVLHDETQAQTQF